MNAAAGTSAQAATLDGCEDCFDHAREAAAEQVRDQVHATTDTAAALADALADQFIARGLTAPCSAHTV